MKKGISVRNTLIPLSSKPVYRCLKLCASPDPITQNIKGRLIYDLHQLKEYNKDTEGNLESPTIYIVLCHFLEGNDALRFIEPILCTCYMRFNTNL